MASSKDEKHITVTPETHKMLMDISMYQRRSMRAVVTKWVEDEHEKVTARSKK